MLPATAQAMERGDARVRASSTPSAGVCACCFVWEVTRGPHAGERAALASLETPSTTLGIGRKAACWLRLRKDLEVSGLHAELQVATTGAQGLALTLRDADSTNGTRVNGVAITSGDSRAVGDQDLIQFGRSTVRVRMGDTQCPRARRQDENDKMAKEMATATTPHEPEHEPVLVVALPKENEIDLSESVAPEAMDHSDENAFETPPKPTVSTTSTLLAVCMVCGQALAAWSVLEQQLHVNACLDRKAGVTIPTTTTTATQPSSTTIAPAVHGKKRKRQATLAKRAADEELAVALALSESLVDPEQQVDTQMALVRGELAQLDAQLTKLQKKRVTLVKKLEKLEKAKRKVHKSEVRAPEEARVLMDREWALRVVFPASREVQAVAGYGGRRRSLRPAVARLLERYRAGDEKEMETSYVSMWQRSAQRMRRSSEDHAEEGREDTNQHEEERDALYVNRLLRWLRTREKERSVLTGTADQTPDEVIMVEEQVEPEKVDEAMASDDGANTSDSESANVGSENSANATALVVPGVVKRVFPSWRENLAFLRTQSVPDLKDALEEMRKMQADRMLDSMTMETSDGTEGKNEEVDACAFFEDEMLRLIAAKESTFHDEVEVIVLADSEGDGDEDGDAQSIEVQRPRSGPPSVQSILDSSDEEGDTGSNESLGQTTSSPMENSDNDAEDVEPSDRDVGASGGFVLAEAMPAPTVLVSNMATASPLEETVALGTQPAVPEESNETRLEGQLLAALKANAKIYESVLLLQPLDLQQFLRYLRDDASIKCPKTALVRFCDRHGITFKSS